MDLVLIGKLAELTGYSKKAIELKVQRGVFAEGIHYVKAPDGRIHFSLENYRKWVLGEPCKGLKSSA